MTADDAQLSNLQYANFCRLLAQRAKSGECRDEKGVLLAWCNVSTPFLNIALLSKPLKGAKELEERVGRITAHAAERKLPWLLPVYEGYVSARLRPQLDEILGRHGLHRVAVFKGMLAEKLKRTRRPLPKDVEFRSFSDAQARYDNAAVNVACYGMPSAWGRELVDSGAACTPEEFGCTGYVDGKPVTAAVAMALDGWLYVAMVATLDGYRKKGYGEAAMRYCLKAAAKATGIRRTALHATEVGFPLYQQMGYEEASTFLIYAAG